MAGWWRLSKRLACLPRPARRRQGGGASIFQDLIPGEALAPESFCEGHKGGGHLPVRRAQTGPPEVESLWNSRPPTPEDPLLRSDRTDETDGIDETNQCHRAL